MLPPVDATISSTNPKFDALYRDLCSNKLNADGTTRLDARAKRERDAFSEELRKARIEAQKRDLVISRLQGLSYQPGALPEEVRTELSYKRIHPDRKQLRDIVAVVAALLEGDIQDEDRDLLHDDITKFKDEIGTIAKAMSKRLQEDAEDLATVSNPDDPPPVESLSDTVRKLKNDIDEARSSVAVARLSLARETSKLQGLYRQIIEASVRVLEQTVHGSVARGTKAEIDYLALVAEGMSKKLSLQHGQLMSQLFSTDIHEVLRAKLDKVGVERANTQRKVREAEDKLERYQKAGGMVGIAQEYAQIMRETEKIQAEIARLEKAKE